MEIQEMLVLLDEMGITEHKIAEEIGIKDRGTITTWYNGTNPRPKYRVKLTRFFNRMRKISEMTLPSDELVDEAMDVLKSLIVGVRFDDMEKQLQQDLRMILLWSRRESPRYPNKEYMLEDMRRRKEGLPTQKEEKDARNVERFTDEWKVMMISRYHPCEFTKLHFSTLPN